MKMNFTSLAHVIFLAGALAAFPGSLIGQEQTVSAPGPEHSAATAPATGYTLDISNGQLHTQGKYVPATMGSLVDALRRLYPNANIVLAPGVRDIQIEDLKLRANSLEAALQALRVASGDQFSWTEQNFAGEGPQPAVIDQTTGLPLKGGPNVETQLYTLTPVPSRHERGLEVFYMGGYFSTTGAWGDKEMGKREGLVRSADAIVNATIDQLYEGRRHPGHPQFQFYDGANLLIVVGSPEALDVARKVLLALPGVTTAQTVGPSLQTLEIPGQSAPASNSSSISGEARERFLQRYGLSPKQSQPTPGSNPNR